jgi:ABC-type lipoprotein release transport system permease subunit
LQLSPNDPFALIASSLMLACFFPAQRATRVTPMTALRTE